MGQSLERMIILKIENNILNIKSFYLFTFSPLSDDVVKTTPNHAVAHLMNLYN